MLVPLPSVLTPGTVVAHRGNRVAERENTVAAFRSAGGAGAAAVELDVRRTRDDRLVVHHDAVVPDIGPICELSLETLRAAAPWLPTLDEALDACSGMWVNVEIKNSSHDPDWDPERTTAALLGMEPTGIIVSSFDWPSVHAAVDAGYPGALLASSSPLDAVEQAASHSMLSVNVMAALLEDDMAAVVVEAAAESGVWVMVWTVNNAQEAARLRDTGVGAIMTDDPARILAALA